MGSIDKRDSGKWRARWRDPNGRSQSKVFARKIDAEKHLTRVEHDKLVGTYIDVSSSRITYAEWAEQYMATTPKRATTAARDRNALKVWLVPHLGDMRLVAITPAHVRRVVDAMSARLKPASVRTVYALLRASMNAAVERDLIMRSPCRGIKLPPAEFAEPRFVSLDELHQIANAMPPQYEAMVYVAGVLGLRFSEIAGLRVERL